MSLFLQNSMGIEGVLNVVMPTLPGHGITPLFRLTSKRIEAVSLHPPTHPSGQPTPHEETLPPHRTYSFMSFGRR